MNKRSAGDASNPLSDNDDNPALIESWKQVAKKRGDKLSPILYDKVFFM